MPKYNLEEEMAKVLIELLDKTSVRLQDAEKLKEIQDRLKRPLPEKEG